MAQSVQVEIEMPAELGDFRLPEGVQRRLQELLDRQDRGEELTPAERREAEGLVDRAEFLSLRLSRAPSSGRTAYRPGPVPTIPKEKRGNKWPFVS